jgi:hypothetical protein
MKVKELQKIVDEMIILDIDVNAYRERFIEKGYLKGVEILNEAERTHDEIKEFNYKDHVFYDYPVANLAIATSDVICRIARFYIHFMELRFFIRTIEVTEELEKIDLALTAADLAKIDSRLSEFIIYNETKLTEICDTYPPYLIQDGKSRLERINNNYGGNIKLILNSDNTSFVEDESEIDFQPNIFYKVDDYRLFLYLASRYAIDKTVMQLSQIYHWMQEKQFIKPKTGGKFKTFVIEQSLTEFKFARIAEMKRAERTPLNELYKTFNSK